MFYYRFKEKKEKNCKTWNTSYFANISNIDWERTRNKNRE